ncbi:hypothetical protein, partial [Endozoicomonas sp. ONNA2]|uniref:hypothetical protein n=1 Tax=Endozoicomonas sp. ONNA2 TaxID=2828741 RepID=UPI0021490BE0
SVCVHPERSRRMTGTIIDAGVHALRQTQDERRFEAQKSRNYFGPIPMGKEEDTRELVSLGGIDV